MPAIALLGALVLAGTPPAFCTDYARTLAWLKQRDRFEWQNIPWLYSLAEGKRLAKEEDRLLAVFIYSGDFAAGRC